MDKLKTTQLTWDLSKMYSSDNDPKIEIDRKNIIDQSNIFINKWKDRTDYLNDPHVLKEALSEYENWHENCANGGDEGYYFTMRYYSNQNDTDVKAKSAKIEEYLNKISNDIRFFCHNISLIPKEKQKEFLDSKDLIEYRHFLENLFGESKYLLTEKEEKILSMKYSPAYGNWVQMVEGLLSKEEREILIEDGTKSVKTLDEILTLLSSKNKEVRSSAAKAYYDIVIKLSDVAEAEINSILLNKKIDDELRNTSRPDEIRHLSDDVSSDVIDVLVETVSERNDISTRFYTLKKKILGMDKMLYYERNIEYGDADIKYTYDDSVNLIYKVFSKLDGQFAEIFKEFVENGHIDVNPRKGKHSGAFCIHSARHNPIYILLNHTDKLRDVLTIAHESGHGINNYLFNKSQNSLNTGGTVFTAECASTFMEDFVLEDILKNADDELKLSIYMQKLNDIVSTIFRQIACYKFEWDLHHDFREKGYLSKDDIGKLFVKNMSAYIGNSVEFDEGSENGWIYWSHIRSFFYVYSYASGLLISKSMQKSVHKDKEYVNKVKEFLKAGSSDSPKNIFMNLGIDVTKKQFWNDGLDEIENLLIETENLAKKLGKI